MAGLDGVRKVITDEVRREVSVLFEDKETAEKFFKKKLEEEGFFVKEAQP